MKLFVAALSFLIAEECSAQTIRLRNQNAYKSSAAGSRRQLQPADGNIFDGASGPTAPAAEVVIDPTEIPIVSLTSMSQNTVSATTIAGVPTEPAGVPTEPAGVPTEPAGVPTEPSEVGIVMSMSVPDVEGSPFTIPPAMSVPGTTSIPGTTATPEFGIDMSVSMPSTPEITTVATTTSATTTTAGSTTVNDLATTAETTTAATSELPAIIEPPTSMSMPESSSSDEVTGSMSMPPQDFIPDDGSGSMSMPQQDHIPPIEENEPTTMPTKPWFNSKGSSESSAYSMGKSCALTVATIVVGVQLI